MAPLNTDIKTTISLFLADKWWMTALRGLFAIVFGLAIMIWPGISLSILLTLFGIFSIFSGSVLLLLALQGRTVEGNWLLILEGCLGLGLGLLTLFRPQTTGIFLLLMVAIWAIITGIFQIGTALRLRREIENEWLLISAGIASALFGLLMALRPVAGATAIMWLVGAYAISLGILLIIFSFRLKSWRQRSLKLHAERSFHQDKNTISNQ